MCQLLGMNCASPTDFNFSFRGFKQRGGKTDIHAHGWGLAIYEGRGVRTFHDPLPCADSPIADIVSSYPIKTHNMMAHIRYATQGAVSLENVHPFTRGKLETVTRKGENSVLFNSNIFYFPILQTQRCGASNLPSRIMERCQSSHYKTLRKRTVTVIRAVGLPPICQCWESV